MGFLLVATVTLDRLLTAPEMHFPHVRKEIVICI